MLEIFGLLLQGILTVLTIGISVVIILFSFQFVVLLLGGLYWLITLIIEGVKHVFNN